MTSASPDPELVDAGKIPAVWANRFNVTVFGDVTRISFKEAVHEVSGGGYRAAIMLRTSDALALAKAISAATEQQAQQSVIGRA